jgi:hypothetical protein
LSEFITIDEQSKHEIVHAFCLGAAQRATHEPLDPRPQMHVCAFDFLGVLLASLRLLGIEIPLIGPLAVGVKIGDAKRGQERFELGKDVVLTPPAHIRQDLPSVVVNSIPQPARIGFAAHITPHCVPLRGEPAPPLQFLGAAHLHLDLFGMQDLSYRHVRLVDFRCLFFHAVMTVLVLTGNTRALSRMPLAFMALSTICCLIAGDCPG